jgi:hypothetical protein
MSQPSGLHLRICRLRDDVGFKQQRRNVRQPRAWRFGLVLLFLLSPLLTFLISCGGLVSSSAQPAVALTVSVTVSPSSVQAFAGDQVQFHADVQNAASSAVIWQVNTMPGGNPTVGMIDLSGVYTAPAAVPTPSTVTVSAVLQSDSTKAASASVTIKSLSTIQGSLSISPALSSITPSQTLQLQVTTVGVNNNLNNRVNWAVGCAPSGNCSTGTITQDGLYTPPNAAGSHMITATLMANPNAIGSAQVEVTDLAGTFTWRNDNSRSGQNQKELVLAPATVASSTFGKLFSCRLDGYAYAQPLYVANLAIPGSGTRNVVFVATEKDSVFAFDADASPCVPLWHTPLIPSGEEAVPAPNSDITSDDIAPFIGITGTPVIDVSSSTLYVVAETRAPTINPTYYERLYALDLATGLAKIEPAGIQVLTLASVSPGFSPLLGNQRAALLLDNGNVYVAFASHGGQGDYHGWLFGYDASTLQQNMFFDVTPGGLQGGIWQSGGGPSADSDHNVFVATGNGTFDVDRGGHNYGDSFLRMSAAGVLSVADYFSPCDQESMFTTGQDLGSSAPVLLPDSAGTVSQPHLMMGGAKNGSLYVVNRDSLGGYRPSPCPPDSAASVQIVPVGDASILSTPLFWNNLIYLAAGNGKLKVFPMAGGSLIPTPLASQSPETLGPQGATLVLSSNGSNDAIIWLIDTSGALTTPPSPNTPAILRAFDANNLSNEIYNSAAAPADRDRAGLAVKFTVPTVANGKVYVGTQTELDVYGLLR